MSSGRSARRDPTPAMPATCPACYTAPCRTWAGLLTPRGCTRTVVLEDNFTAVLTEAMDELPDEWDVLLLGALGAVHPSYKYGINLMHAFAAGGMRWPRRRSHNLHTPLRPFGTHAYAISVAGARKLLAANPRASYHVDVIAWGQRDINLYAVHPLLAKQTHGDTTIGARPRGERCARASSSHASLPMRPYRPWRCGRRGSRPQLASSDHGRRVHRGRLCLGVERAATTRAPAQLATPHTRCCLLAPAAPYCRGPDHRQSRNHVPERLPLDVSPAQSRPPRPLLCLDQIGGVGQRGMLVTSGRAFGTSLLLLALYWLLPAQRLPLLYLSGAYFLSMFTVMKALTWPQRRIELPPPAPIAERTA